MAKNRYKGAEITRTTRGRLKILSSGDRKLYRVELWMLNDKVNRNNWKYINLAAHLPEFKDIPILTAYLPSGKIGDGHNYDLKRDPKTGETYASFTAADAERIVGWIPKDADIRLERKDDTSWIVASAFLWKWYAPELVDMIARQGNGMEISIETLVTKEHMEGDVAVEEEYVVLGVTVLGTGVAPAVAGATIQSLSAMRNSMEKMCLKAASYAKEVNATAQTITHNKGVKENMIDKARLKELSEKFTGYNVVGASSDLKHLALVDANGAPFTYSVEESDKGNIIPDRIMRANAYVAYEIGEADVQVGLETFMGEAEVRYNAAVEQAKADAKTIKHLSEQLTAMKSKEDARRLNAAKSALEDEFKQCSGAEGKFDSEILKDLRAKVEKGEFTAREDADGNWLGETEVRMSVKALCMDEQKKLDEAAAKAQEKRYYNFNNVKGNSAGSPRTFGELFKGETHE